MKTKTYFSNKILSLVLALVMVVSMLPTVNMSAFAATEVENLGENTPTLYTDGLTQYFKYDNYLYQVKFTNLKAADKRVSVRTYSGIIYLSILGNNVGSSLDMLKNRRDNTTEWTTSDLPKDVGGTISGYIYDLPNAASYLSPAYEYCNVVEDPVVIITCISADGPQWSWADDYSSANAIFTASEADVQVTLDADVSFVAEACSEGDDITYTASVTFNGKQYTDYKEAVKPHDWNKIEGQTCDQLCSRCKTVREVAHTYDNTCDTDCNICTAEREIEHTYDSVCDPICNVCDAERDVQHTYDNDCDTICNFCSIVRTVKHDVNGDYCTLCGEKLYGVLVAGNYVTSKNASDVLGDGTVSYDAVTNTLTLNGAHVDMTETNKAIHNDTKQEIEDRFDNNEMFEPYFNPLTPPLQIIGGELTLVLQGENTLIGLDSILGLEFFEGFFYGVPAISIADGTSLTVTGDDTATMTLLTGDIGYTEHDHIPYTASISGGSLTVIGGTITTDNGIHLGGDYIQNGGSVEAGFIEAENVTVFDGILNTRGYSGITPTYSVENAGGIHGIFARENISISGGYVWTASGVLGHDGNYRGPMYITGDEVVTHGLYALESITVSGGTVNSTGGYGGYVIGDLGDLVQGNYGDGEIVGTPAGSALEAPEWSISEEATFVCGSDTSHRVGEPTCCGTLCSFCDLLLDEAKDPDNHASTGIDYTNNGDGTHFGVHYCCDTLYVTNEAHSGGTATCVTGKFCECCNAEYGEVDADAHYIVIDEYLAPTCTETGLTEGSHCLFCDNATVAQEVVPVLDHIDEDGDYLCDHDCGYEFEKPEEGFKPSLNAQTNADGSQIRFVACVDSLNYKEVGFVITNANNKEQTITKNSKTVYTSIAAGGKTVTAADITGDEGMKYILTYTVKNLPVDAAFEVTSFVVNLDGTITYGETETYTVADMLA